MEVVWVTGSWQAGGALGVSMSGPCLPVWSRLPDTTGWAVLDRTGWGWFPRGNDTLNSAGGSGGMRPSWEGRDGGAWTSMAPLSGQKADGTCELSRRRDKTTNRTREASAAAGPAMCVLQNVRCAGGTGRESEGGGAPRVITPGSGLTFSKGTYAIWFYAHGSDVQREDKFRILGEDCFKNDFFLF